MTTCGFGVLPGQMVLASNEMVPVCWNSLGPFQGNVVPLACPLVRLDGRECRPIDCPGIAFGPGLHSSVSLHPLQRVTNGPARVFRSHRPATLEGDMGGSRTH